MVPDDVAVVSIVVFVVSVFVVEELLLLHAANKSVQTRVNKENNFMSFFLVMRLKYFIGLKVDSIDQCGPQKIFPDNY